MRILVAGDFCPRGGVATLFDKGSLVKQKQSDIDNG